MSGCWSCCFGLVLLFGSDVGDVAYLVLVGWRSCLGVRESIGRDF